MISFSLNRTSLKDEYAIKVITSIENHKNYFKKFNGSLYDEAMQKALEHALTHRKSNYQEIDPYIKKLARTIMLNEHKKSPLLYELYNEDGEIHGVFNKLRSFLDIDQTDINRYENELHNKFKDLYLLDEDSFMLLKQFFNESCNEGIKSIKNKEFKKNVDILIKEYGFHVFLYSLYTFFNILPKLINRRVTNNIKNIYLKKPNFKLLEKIPDTPLIREKGKQNGYIFLDKVFLLSDKNPDFVDWELINPTTCDILRVDLTPFIDYIYDNVSVKEGVDTRFIRWCGDRYKVITPSGASYIGLEIDKYISYVRVELVLNILGVGLGSVLAISPENMYLKVTKSFIFDKFRVIFNDGKSIDLPIYLHKKGRC